MPLPLCTPSPAPRAGWPATARKRPRGFAPAGRTAPHGSNVTMSHTNMRSKPRPDSRCAPSATAPPMSWATTRGDRAASGPAASPIGMSAWRSRPPRISRSPRSPACPTETRGGSSPGGTPRCSTPGTTMEKTTSPSVYDVAGWRSGVATTPPVSQHVAQMITVEHTLRPQVDPSSRTKTTGKR